MFYSCKSLYGLNFIVLLCNYRWNIISFLNKNGILSSCHLYAEYCLLADFYLQISGGNAQVRDLGALSRANRIGDRFRQRSGFYVTRCKRQAAGRRLFIDEGNAENDGALLQAVKVHTTRRASSASCLVRCRRDTSWGFLHREINPPQIESVSYLSACRLRPAHVARRNLHIENITRDASSRV